MLCDGEDKGGKVNNSEAILLVIILTHIKKRGSGSFQNLMILNSINKFLLKIPKFRQGWGMVSSSTTGRKPTSKMTSHMFLANWCCFTWGFSQHHRFRVRTCVLSHFSHVCDPMDYSLPGSSVYGIFQARILEWVAITSSRGSFWPRDRTHIS